MSLCHVLLANKLWCQVQGEGKSNSISRWEGWQNHIPKVHAGGRSGCGHLWKWFATFIAILPYEIMIYSCFINYLFFSVCISLFSVLEQCSLYSLSLNNTYLYPRVGTLTCKFLYYTVCHWFNPWMWNYGYRGMDCIYNLYPWVHILKLFSVIMWEACIKIRAVYATVIAVSRKIPIWCFELLV